MDSAKEYRARLEQWREKEKTQDKKHRRVGDIRLGCAVLLIILVWFCGKTFLAVEVAFTGLLVGLFFSGLLHDRVLKSRDLATRARRFYQAGLERLEGKWAGQGNDGAKFLDTHHPYAADLDLFGRGSLFELINTAQTQDGQAVLAHWLLHGARIDEIRDRHSAVLELRDHLNLREDLATLTSDPHATIQTEALVVWAERPPVFIAASVRALAFILALLPLGLLFANQFIWFIAALAVQRCFARAYSKKVHAILELRVMPARDLHRLGEIFVRLEQEQFNSARLSQLQAGWSCGEERASRSLPRLGRMMDWMDSQEHLLMALLGKFFLLDTQMAFALEARRAQIGQRMKTWLRDLGEMEALCSLAGYAFEHPADPFPELLEKPGAPFLCGEQLGHPLLPEERCVRNSITLNADSPLLIISGSNMSGKSTWLRTLGVNIVLAQAGAPVRARKLQLTPLQLGASMRNVDSLNEGVSRFYAEISRLRQIVDLARNNQRMLFLLDELLSGTNSHDRRIGAGFVVKSLLKHGAIGIITTHDLALAAIADEMQPPGANFHFEDQLEQGRMSFDYTLRPGVVEKSNALELMRSLGLED